VPEIEHGHGLGVGVLLASQDVDHQRVDLRRGRRIGRLSSVLTQLQQANGNGSGKAQEPLEILSLIQLAAFDATAGFEALMEIFTEPTAGVPINQTPGIGLLCINRKLRHEVASKSEVEKCLQASV
jgi:hypothetical protein